MIRPPIFVDARGSLLAFSSPAELLRHATAEAIRAGAYPVLYDADGRLLRLVVKVEEYKLLGLVRRVRERIELEATEHLPTHEVALRALLLRFVRPGPPEEPLPATGAHHPLAGLVRT